MIDRAINAAKDVYNFKHKHGAAIFKNNRLLAIGHNKKYPSRHAEEDAICKVLKNNNKRNHLRGSTIYVVRVGKNGMLKNSMPCNKCLSLIKFVGIRHIIYSTIGGNIQQIDL